MKTNKIITGVIIAATVVVLAFLTSGGYLSQSDLKNPTNTANQEEIRIAIGIQSMCTDTYTGGTIMKELGLLEKNLPKDRKYNVVWEDYPSGGPITNQMIAGKLDIGLMGDMPLVINGYKGQSLPNYQSYLIALTGWNDKGVGNALLVPKNSSIKTVAELKGKTVSVPFGSTSHRFLLKALGDSGLTEKDVTILDQSVTIGSTNIEQEKVDAHATFCPYGELLVHNDVARKIYDGEESNIPYIHGVVIRKEFADKYPEVVVAYLKALIDTNAYVRAHPEEISKDLEKWTKYPYDVNKFYIEKFIWDATLSEYHTNTLKDAADYLESNQKIGNLNVKEWVNDSFLKQAAKEKGLVYGKNLL